MESTTKTLNIMKFGGGSMKTATDVAKVVEYFLVEKGCIMVVSAFSGMTNLLEEVVAGRNPDKFFQEFLPYHRVLIKSLGIKGLGEFLEAQSLRFQKSFDELCGLERDSRAEERCSANIISMGEDFAQIIIGSYLKTRVPDGKTMEMVDSRNVIVAQSNSSGYIGESFDQEATEKLASLAFVGFLKKVYVVQGFVCGKHNSSSNEVLTALLKREGSDVTAMLIFISLTKALSHVPDVDVRLTFVKTFGEDALIGEMGLGKLFIYMERHQRTIISQGILEIQDLHLGRYFSIVDFKNRAKSATVWMEKHMIEMLSEKRKLR